MHTYTHHNTYTYTIPHTPQAYIHTHPTHKHTTHAYTHHTYIQHTTPHTHTPNATTHTTHIHTHMPHIHTHTAHAHAHTHTHRAPRPHCCLFWGRGPTTRWGTAGRQPPTPSSAPARVPSSFLHSPDLHFHSCLLYRSLVPLQDLEVLAALQDEDMARGPDTARRWATLVVLAAVGTAVTTTNPGIVVRITQKGLDYGNWLPSFPSLPSLTEHLLYAALKSRVWPAHCSFKVALSPRLTEQEAGPG